MDPMAKSTLVKNDNLFASLYDSLRLNILGLSRQAFDYAMQGLDYLTQTGRLSNEKIISIADFSLPSSKKRLFVIDLEKGTLVYNTYVAHGSNSGLENARQFSNTPSSYQSSLGFYETRDTYMGGNGYSLRLEGLEPGFNDNAERRAIVVHGAPYVNESLARTRGYIGRSWGCPALPQELSRPVIDKIKHGTCLFIYSPNQYYLDHSKVLHPAGNLASR
ncbi:MAG: murein L,D-transpeptidase catalytic domain family protein [Chitinophagaceae bacterium]|nr:murein L,D-transpeptidase catalytic domain family protein [Chitinophagaceae bacterium]